MAAIFLDVNSLIELLKLRPPSAHFNPKDHHFFASPLSFHIIAYTFKLKMSDSSLRKLANQIELIPITASITSKAMTGPTNDLDDNIQLHSASIANCDQFLTNDKNLLKLGYFGQTQIIKAID